jgi:hypothetical protein
MYGYAENYSADQVRLKLPAQLDAPLEDLFVVELAAMSF